MNTVGVEFYLFRGTVKLEMFISQGTVYCSGAEVQSCCYRSCPVSGFEVEDLRIHWHVNGLIIKVLWLKVWVLSWDFVWFIKTTISLVSDSNLKWWKMFYKWGITQWNHADIRKYSMSRWCDIVICPSAEPLCVSLFIPQPFDNNYNFKIY